jgi:hypothetical protein
MRCATRWKCGSRSANGLFAVRIPPGGVVPRSRAGPVAWGGPSPPAHRRRFQSSVSSARGAARAPTLRWRYSPRRHPHGVVLTAGCDSGSARRGRFSRNGAGVGATHRFGRRRLRPFAGDLTDERGLAPSVGWSAVVQDVDDHHYHHDECDADALPDDETSP